MKLKNKKSGKIIAIRKKAHAKAGRKNA